MTTIYDEILDAIAKVEATNRMDGYTLIVPRHLVDQVRAMVDANGWTGIVVTASAYAPENTVYLFRPR